MLQLRIVWQVQVSDTTMLNNGSNAGKQKRKTQKKLRYLSRLPTGAATKLRNRRIIYFYLFCPTLSKSISMIKLQVIGNLGKDSVVNNVNGKNVINFSVAHTEKFKDAQGVQKDKTIWVECAYWTDRTAVAPYLKKGTLVFTEGQPDIRSYTTKDGGQGASLSLRVSTVQLLGGRAENQGGETGGNSFQNQPAAYNPASYNQTPSGSTISSNDITEPSDDLPF
jgi:single-strand DNA-binding protein